MLQKSEFFTNLPRSGMKIKESIPEKKHQHGAKWWDQEIHVPMESEKAQELPSGKPGYFTVNFGKNNGLIPAHFCRTHGTGG